MKKLVLTLVVFLICSISYAQSWRYADNHPYKRGVLPQPPTPYSAPLIPKVPQLYKPYHPYQYYYQPPVYRTYPYFYHQSYPTFAYGVSNNGFYWYYRIR